MNDVAARVECQHERPKTFGQPVGPTQRARVSLGRFVRGSPTRVPHHVLDSYVLRNVTAGSTRIARRAGMRHANAATAVRSTQTAPKVSGSAGGTPKSSPSM